MAKETGTEYWIGSDHEFPFTIKNEAETACVDITGWSLSWMVKRYASESDISAVLTKTTSAGITIAGTFDADPAVNTQKATVAVADTDSDLLSPGLYVYELKRTNAGSEAILAYGPIELIQGVHRT